MEGKKYHYDKLLFLFDVKITGGFCLLIVFVCLYLAIRGIVNAPLMIIAAIIAFYTMWNSFIAKTNTQIVTINDQAISFYAFGREDVYELADIKKLRIREFPTGGKMYIRINDYGLMQGRYWIQFKKFSDGPELFKKFLDIEYELHPDTLKARARRVNTEYLEMEKKKGSK